MNNKYLQVWRIKQCIHDKFQVWNAHYRVILVPSAISSIHIVPSAINSICIVPSAINSIYIVPSAVNLPPSVCVSDYLSVPMLQHCLYIHFQVWRAEYRIVRWHSKRWKSVPNEIKRPISFLLPVRQLRPNLSPS